MAGSVMNSCISIARMYTTWREKPRAWCHCNRQRLQERDGGVHTVVKVRGSGSSGTGVGNYEGE